MTSPSWSRALRIVLAGMLLTLTACTQAATPPSPSASTSAVTTATAPRPTPSATPLPPAIPEAATHPTRASAEAFFRYYWTIFNYSYKYTDTTALRTLFSPICESCSKNAQNIEAAVRAGGHFSGGEASVVVVVAAPGNPAKGILVNAVIEQRPSAVIAKNGQILGRFSGAKARSVDAALLWSQNKWTMLAVDVYANGVG